MKTAVNFSTTEQKWLTKWPRLTSTEVQHTIIKMLQNAKSVDYDFLESQYEFHVKLARTLRKVGR